MREEKTHINEQEAAGSSELLTVREAYLRLRISKWKLYDLIRRRLLDTVQIGRRRLIPASALQRLIQRLKEGSL